MFSPFFPVKHAIPVTGQRERRPLRLLGRPGRHRAPDLLKRQRNLRAQRPRHRLQQRRGSGLAKARGEHEPAAAGGGEAGVQRVRV